MPSQSNHLVLRSSTWHCRLDIPADLRPAYGHHRILSKSLKTGDKLLARELAAVQVGQWKAEFRKIRDAKLRAGDRWKESLASFSTEIEKITDPFILAMIKGEPLPSNAPEARTAKEDLALREGFARSLLSFAKQAGYPDLVGKLKSLSAANPSTPVLMHEISGLVREIAAYNAQSKHLLNGSELSEALVIAKSPKTYKPKSPISSTALDNFAAYYAQQNANARTRGVYLSNIKRFSKWLTTNGKELTFDSVAEYLDSVSKVRQTREGHLAALRKFHKWAVRYEPYYRELMGEKRSPFDNHEHPKVGENAGAPWIEYTRPEAEKLHAAAVSKGDTELADLIAFACYTGCRIEELGRIRKETTIFDDAGKPVGFHVDDAKTPAGVRDIPLHPALLPIFERRLRNPQGTSRALFPGNEKTKSGLRLSGLSQRFSKLKRAEGFSDRHVFHSFRKTTATMLQQANVPLLTIPFILGHETGTLTFDTYSAGPSFEQKLEAICKLQFSFENNA